MLRPRIFTAFQNSLKKSIYVNCPSSIQTLKLQFQRQNFHASTLNLKEQDDKNKKKNNKNKNEKVKKDQKLMSKVNTTQQMIQTGLKVSH